MQSDQKSRQQSQRAGQLDRWIDLLATLHGLPRIVVLRQFRSSAHVGMAVARLIAAHQEEEAPTGEAHYGYVTAAPKPRDEQTPAERAQRDAETDDILRKIKEEQQAGKAEQPI